MSKTFKVAVLGATGAVGQEMMKVLEEYEIPVSRLLPLASARSAGGTVRFRGENVLIEEATDASFDGMDFVLGAVEADMSRRFAPAIKKSGAVYIDNSSAFRLEPDVPLVVPEINGGDAFLNKGKLLDHHHHDGRSRDRGALPHSFDGREHLPSRFRRRDQRSARA